MGTATEKVGSSSSSPAALEVAAHLTSWSVTDRERPRTIVSMDRHRSGPGRRDPVRHSMKIRIQIQARCPRSRRQSSHGARRWVSTAVGATVASNLGDGLVVAAFPLLAASITRSPNGHRRSQHRGGPSLARVRSVRGRGRRPSRSAPVDDRVRRRPSLCGCGACPVRRRRPSIADRAVRGRVPNRPRRDDRRHGIAGDHARAGDRG
jgi:hypothetical protein